jgi:hypothetical protein
LSQFQFLAIEWGDIASAAKFSTEDAKRIAAILVDIRQRAAA